MTHSVYSHDNVLPGLAILITIFTFPEHKQTNREKGQKTHLKCILEIFVVAILIKCVCICMYVCVYTHIRIYNFSHCRENTMPILKMFCKFMLGGIIIVKRHSKLLITSKISSSKILILSEEVLY